MSADDVIGILLAVAVLALACAALLLVHGTLRR